MNATVLIHVCSKELKEITTVTTGKLSCSLQMTGDFGSGFNFSINTVEKRNCCYLPKDMTLVSWLPDQIYCNFDSF